MQVIYRTTLSDSFHYIQYYSVNNIDTEHCHSNNHHLVSETQIQ